MCSVQMGTKLSGEQAGVKYYQLSQMGQERKAYAKDLIMEDSVSGAK